MVCRILVVSLVLKHLSQKNSQKVQSWVSVVSNIAESEPHAAFAGFTHGVSASWNYFARVTNISSLNSSSDL